MHKRPINASPQIGVRFPQDEMDRLRERAKRDFAGNISTLVKVAVRRLLGDGQGESEQSEKVADAA
jgi:hypothetical protein